MCSVYIILSLRAQTGTNIYNGKWPFCRKSPPTNEIPYNVISWNRWFMRNLLTRGCYHTTCTQKHSREVCTSVVPYKLQRMASQMLVVWKVRIFKVLFSVAYPTNKRLQEKVPFWTLFLHPRAKLCPWMSTNTSYISDSQSDAGSKSIRLSSCRLCFWQNLKDL